MIILKQQIESQTIKFIPRFYLADTLILRNETTNVETIYHTADFIYDFIDRITLDGGIFESKSCLINTFGITNDVKFVVDGYYLKCDLVLDLKENTFYNLTVLNTTLPFTADNGIKTVDNNILTADVTRFSIENSLIYRDKIFCTNQNKDNYTVNENQYVANVTNNEFKIYE
jgi:hypothetical protein